MVHQQLVKGMYAGFLPIWLEVWPRDRFMLLRTEDYKVAPSHHVAAVARFLGEGGGGRCEKACLRSCLSSWANRSSSSSSSRWQGGEEGWEAGKEVLVPVSQSLAAGY
jgi:hypothetical protein